MTIPSSGARQGGWKSVDPKGKVQRWQMTERDVKILVALVRWGYLTTGEIMRHVEPPEAWYPPLIEALRPPVDADPEQISQTDGVAHLNPAKVWEHRERVVRRRLQYMATAKPWELTHAYRTMLRVPLWIATGAGHKVAEVDWGPMRNSAGNSPIVNHAMDAARVGLSLEWAGYRVLAEREIWHGAALDGGVCPPGLVLNVADKSTGKITQRAPDLALPLADGTGYIAVEIERARDRSLNTYLAKLDAYKRSPHVRGVIYAVTGKNTAGRVSVAATEVFGANTNTFSMKMINPDSHRYAIDHHKGKVLAAMLPEVSKRTEAAEHRQPTASRGGL